MRGIVTIDGPSASGKSSVARRVAAALGVPYLSSGLLYRAAAFLPAGMAEGSSSGCHAMRIRAMPATATRARIACAAIRYE